jgi:hypothetical protein
MLGPMVFNPTHPKKSNYWDPILTDLNKQHFYDGSELFLGMDWITIQDWMGLTEQGLKLV